MKKQISTQLKANLRKMGKEWAAAKTFWSRQNDDLLYVEFPKDSPLEDKVLKAQAAFEWSRNWVTVKAPPRKS